MENENVKDQNQNTRVVYNMKIAVELIRKGHKVLTTAINPNNNRYTVWIFELDDTFDTDFEVLKGASAHGK